VAVRDHVCELAYDPIRRLLMLEEPGLAAVAEVEARPTEVQLDHEPKPADKLEDERLEVSEHCPDWERQQRLVRFAEVADEL
jgi:hypothetical protein